MQRFLLAGALLVSVVSSASIASAQAPTDKGVVNEDGEKAKSEKSAAGDMEKQSAQDDADLTALKKQIADLQAELKNLSGMLAKITDSQKELEKVQADVAALEGDNAALANRVKALEGDNANLLERLAKVETAPKEQTTLKPAFVKSAVRFFNHEGRSVKMNVNGVWHTVKAGENTIWVPYAPVHIYRYTGAEPRTFWKWKEHMDGYVMDFDVGKPQE